jgi:hypothetical protein
VPLIQIFPSPCAARPRDIDRLGTGPTAECNHKITEIGFPVNRRSKNLTWAKKRESTCACGMDGGGLAHR